MQTINIWCNDWGQALMVKLLQYRTCYCENIQLSIIAQDRANQILLPCASMHTQGFLWTKSLCKGASLFPPVTENAGNPDTSPYFDEVDFLPFLCLQGKIYIPLNIA